ncbi:LamG-like jellyroll fold domain-containing protein [Pelagicoccus sp. SDUM812005]|uniref:LamG-like jellyroll fold domain-containing protein n=1 Tax=Pelagicoccus sp. SDUM812005 TaxID=3041257 RepID=UPI00280C8655|nr:LamG-like jellyroll fold domain-containing protein [Pelagicoccus sp. SDUM812005]MDQ8182955.1 hypothetical protein [Pelagicoccus sp. SDUM812005]
MRLKLSLVAAVSCLAATGAAQTTVTSLPALLPYLDDDNANVKLAPGTYSITAADITNGTYGYTVSELGSTAVLLFSGNNSTYDFTDAKIEMDTDVLQAFGSVKVFEIQVIGSNNVLKNLTLEDLGDTRPKKSAVSLVVDGAGNLIEGFHMTVRGSYPYGYGDVFGKGGPYTIKHFKHSALLLRGFQNHIKNCIIIHRSYGHAIFMQAADEPLIEGCYVEGEMRTTDDMLAETSGPAFDIAFETVWGYTLPAGYKLSLGEGGIRAYNAGTTLIDGVVYSRGTSNVTVRDCTIKNMRTGVTLAHATGTKEVSGTMVIGSENGFSLGSGVVRTSGADIVYGPLLKNAYSSDKNYTADIMLLPPSEDFYNGTQAVAYIGGSNHNLTFRGTEFRHNPDLKVMVSGDYQGIRMLNGANPSQNNLTSNSVEINNLTHYPLVIHSDSTGATGQSVGPLTDNGSGSNITSASLQTLPEPWAAHDIGDVGAAGSSSYANGVFTVVGSGNDIWNSADEFQFAYRYVNSSDATITAKVDSVDNTNGWAKAGVMIREHVGTGSPQVSFIRRPTQGISFQWRDTHSGGMTSVKDTTITGAVWLRLVRSGNTVTGYYSSNGTSWTNFASATIDLNESAPMGLCVTSHNDGVLCTGTFSNVSLDAGDVVGSWDFGGVYGSHVPDSSGYSNPALVAGATVDSGVNGGTALRFDGVDDTVAVPASVFDDVLNEISIAMWVFGDSTQARNDSVFYAENSSGNRVLNIHLPWSNSQVYWDAGNNGGSSYDRINKTASSTEFEGQWNHWVFTKNASTGNMNIYLNGALWHSGMGKTKTITGISAASIGSGISNNYYDGRLDEVMVFKTELSASDVSLLYNSY